MSPSMSTGIGSESVKTGQKWCLTLRNAIRLGALARKDKAHKMNRHSCPRNTVKGHV